VKALDHLRSGRPDAEYAAAAGQRIDPGGGHGQQRRAARVERQDGRADLDPLGDRGEESHHAGAVEPVELRDPQHIDAASLEVTGSLPEYTRITLADARAQSHLDASLAQSRFRRQRRVLGQLPAGRRRSRNVSTPSRASSCWPAQRNSIRSRSSAVARSVSSRNWRATSPRSSPGSRCAGSAVASRAVAVRYLVRVAAGSGTGGRSPGGGGARGTSASGALAGGPGGPGAGDPRSVQASFVRRMAAGR
jgi:hypothetical protein